MNDFSKPTSVSDVQLAFSAEVENLMPPYKDIPDEFKRGSTKWNRLFADRFYWGVKNLEFEPKEGIDPGTAWRHIEAVCGSYAPKHEHKEAAVAYLMSLWFSDATWEPGDKKKEMTETINKMVPKR